jgi:hypothetical protein
MTSFSGSRQSTVRLPPGEKSSLRCCARTPNSWPRSEDKSAPPNGPDSPALRQGSTRWLARTPPARGRGQDRTGQDRSRCADASFCEVPRVPRRRRQTSVDCSLSSVARVCGGAAVDARIHPETECSLRRMAALTRPATARWLSSPRQTRRGSFCIRRMHSHGSATTTRSASWPIRMTPGEPSPARA